MLLFNDNICHVFVKVARSLIWAMLGGDGSQKGQPQTSWTLLPTDRIHGTASTTSHVYFLTTIHNHTRCTTSCRGDVFLRIWRAHLQYASLSYSFTSCSHEIVTVLILNAIAILSEDRFLARSNIICFHTTLTQTNFFSRVHYARGPRIWRCRRHYQCQSKGHQPDSIRAHARAQ